jgi:hypothetical protein
MSDVLEILMLVMMDDDLGMANHPFINLWWPSGLVGILMVTPLSSPFDYGLDCVINEEAISDKGMPAVPCYI